MRGQVHKGEPSGSRGAFDELIYILISYALRYDTMQKECHIEDGEHPNL